jgi:rRNA processing protein Krr1/Pno1
LLDLMRKLRKSLVLFDSLYSPAWSSIRLVWSVVACSGKSFLTFCIHSVFRRLERERTAKSMDLKDEKEILRQMSRAEKTKREVQEFETYDKAIKDRKAKTVELRESLKTLNAAVSTLRTEVSVRSAAKKLGCNVEDLLGMKVDCPKDKIGNVIGRKGSVMKNIMQKSNVNVDVNRDSGNIMILGSRDALGLACEDLDRIFASIEKTVDASPVQVKYFTSKSIAAVTDFRNRHPNVILSVTRANTQALRLRGLPNDIESAEKELLSFIVIQKELRVAPKLSAAIVGKQGAIIERLVLDHQATIDIQRNKDDDSIISVAGPVSSVEAAMKEIDEMISAAKESTETIAVDPNLRSALLLRGGAGIHALNKKASDATKEHGPSVSLSMSEDGIVVKGNVMVTTVAVEMLKEEICQLEASIVRIKVDPFALPVFIGKGGKTLKKLKDGKTVNVEIDRVVGEVTICGLDKSEVASVEESFRSFASENLVERISVDSSVLKRQSILRSNLGKEISELVFAAVDEAASQIILRGTTENIEKASELIHTSLAKKFTEEIVLSANDMKAVLSGGKNSMVANLSKEIGVSLNSDRDRSVIVAIGEADKVKSAVDRINLFLQGGEEMISAAKEGTETVAVDPNLRSALLMKGGAGIQELNRKVSAVTEEHGAGISLSMGDGGIIVEGNGNESGIEILREVICQLEASIVRIKVDPFALPVFIGKGGKTLKKLKDGKIVNVEMDRIVGEVTICGLVKSEVLSVEESFRSFAAENLVERISVDKSVVKSLLRSKLGKEISDLVFAAPDEAASQILLRGTAENIQKASELIHASLAKKFTEEIHLSADDMKTVLSGGKDSMVAKLSKEIGVSLNSERDRSVIVARGEADAVKKANELIHAFLAKKFTQEIVLSADEMRAVLSGGKDSMVANLSKEIGVSLNSDRDRSVIVARGEADKVKSAVDRINRFLQGGEGLEMTRIALNEQLIGLIIGKRGKTMTDLQKKHEKVAIIVLRVENAVTLRGPPSEIEDCRTDIMKLVSAARTTQTIDVTEEKRKELDRSRIARRVAQSLSVQISGADGKISVRGAAPDVEYVVSLLNEHISGIYESRVNLEESHFHKLSEACRESDHFGRIEKCSGAELVLDSTERALVVRGRRDKVKLAKTEIATFFQLFFSPNFLLLKVLSPLVSAGRLPFSIADVMAITGATIQLDREIDSIYVSSIDSKKVEKAAEILGPKIQAAEKLIFVLEIDATEEWLISSFIGKNGSHINSLRKELGCNIDVLSKERKITVTANNEQLLAKARSMLEKVVDDARGERAFVKIPEGEMAAFVGRSGAHIKEFSQIHAVEVQVMKNMSSTVRITGDEKAVLAAKAAVSEWLTTRDEAIVEASATLHLKKYQVPVVIGTKGSVARGLEEEFGCRIDIDRSELTVTIRGGTSENREGAVSKIKEILSGDSQPEDADTKSLDTDSESSTVDEALAAENRVVTDRHKTTEKRSETSQPRSQEEVLSPPPQPLPPFIETASDFPALTLTEMDEAVGESKDNEEESTGSSTDTANEKPKIVEGGLSWASMVTKEKAEPRRSFISTVSDEDWYCSDDDGDDLGEDPEAGGLVEKVVGIIV